MTTASSWFSTLTANVTLPRRGPGRLSALRDLEPRVQRVTGTDRRHVLDVHAGQRGQRAVRTDGSGHGGSWVATRAAVPRSSLNAS
jgi:hypothetical protein